MRRFLNKLTCMALSLTFLMGCMATPAFAYSGGGKGEEGKNPAVFEEGGETGTGKKKKARPPTPGGDLTGGGG